MDIPWHITLAMWISFPIGAVVVVGLGLVHYIHHIRSARGSVVCAFASILLVLTSFLLVNLVIIDLFFVSSTKSNYGIRQKWATNQTIAYAEKAFLYGYYGVFTFLVLLMVFLFSLLYFSYKPIRTAEASRWNIGHGFLCTLAPVVLLMIVLILSVSYLSTNTGCLKNFSANLYKQLNIIGQLEYPTRSIDAGLVCVINCIALIGMVHSLIYTAFGMTILPVNFINGEPNNEQQRQPTEESIPHRENQTLNNSDHQTLRYNSERLVYHQCKEGSLHHQNYSCFTKLKCLVRPLQVMGGVLLCLFAWLIIITLALSNTNRYLSSHGIKTGYLAGNTSVVNPINYLLFQSNGVFPVHYLLLGGIAFYLAASSVAGMKYIGLWFLWKKIHNIEEGNTLPHAILFSSFVVSTVMVYTVILFYSLFPQYAMYGSQTYQVNEMLIGRIRPFFQVKVLQCSMEGPADQCDMTRLLTFQVKFFNSIWPFGAIFYWSNWLLILVFIIGFMVSMKRIKIATDAYSTPNGSQENLVTEVI